MRQRLDAQFTSAFHPRYVTARLHIFFIFVMPSRRGGVMFLWHSFCMQHVGERERWICIGHRLCSSKMLYLGALEVTVLRMEMHRLLFMVGDLRFSC